MYIYTLFATNHTSRAHVLPGIKASPTFFIASGSGAKRMRKMKNNVRAISCCPFGQ